MERRDMEDGGWKAGCNPVQTKKLTGREYNKHKSQKQWEEGREKE
jgi:hypothetical protein